MKPILQNNVHQCISCGNDKLNLHLVTKDYFLTLETFNLLKCESCGLIMTSPFPAPEMIGRYYESKDYFSHTTEKRNVTSILYKKFREINIMKKFRLVESFNTGRSILDYGCGSGQLLHYFKEKGWQISGMEPNNEARLMASKLNEIEILSPECLSSIDEKSFDVITLWHVLEHVHKLNETMLKLSSLLKENGLLIIAVPNINSPDSIKYKEHWAGLDVPRHLYHFNPESMNSLISKHSMQLIQTHPMKFDSYYVSLLSEKYLGNKFPYFFAFLNGWRSNRNAKNKNNYSSIIYIAKHN